MVPDRDPNTYLGTKESLTQENNNNPVVQELPAPDKVVVVSLPAAGESEGVTCAPSTDPAATLSEAFTKATTVVLRPRLAAQLLRTYGEDACREKLELLRQNLDRIEKGPIPWYRSALEGDWTATTDWTPASQRRRLTRLRATEAARQELEAAEVTKRRRLEGEAALATAYEALGPTDRNRVDTEVAARLQDRLGTMAATLSASSVLRNAALWEVMAEFHPQSVPAEEVSIRAGQ